MFLRYYDYYFVYTIGRQPKALEPHVALLPILEAGVCVLILGSLPPIGGGDLFFSQHLC